MTKFEIVSQIAAKTGVEQNDVRQVVQHTLDAIIDVLVAEGRLELRDFGVFEVVTTRARRGRNPRSGAAVTIAAGKRVRFSAGKRLAEVVNPNGSSDDRHTS